MTLGKYIFFGWFVAMTVVSGFVIAEYCFLKEQAEQLTSLKSDYNRCIMALKQQVENTSPNDETSTSSDINQKTVTSKEDNEPQFLVVNREPAYLERSALSFARLHNLENALKKVYEKNSPTKNNYKKSRKERLKIGRKAKAVTPSIKNSLKKRIFTKNEHRFIWPLHRSQFWLSSPFGNRKNGKKWELHKGIDLAAVRGTDVKAAAGGVVIQAHYSAGYGNTIVIMHDNTYKTRYAHLDKILVKVGQEVAQGDCIGKVGSTGCVRASRGRDPSHLHFEVYVLDKQVNPSSFLP